MIVDLLVNLLNLLGHQGDGSRQENVTVGKK
jgi:hypothetical protein